jgi:hypothetical protein
MSKTVTFNWTAQDPTAVCAAQTIAGPGPLIINGTLASKNDGQFRTATFAGLERTVSVTSAADLSAILFVITGTLRGQVVSETIAGPDTTPTTAYTTQEFTTVTSVYVSGAIGVNVGIGSGDTGHTFWYLSDYHRSINALSVGVSVLAGTVDYTFETTLEDPSVAASPSIWTPIDGVTVPTIPAATPMILASDSVLANYTFPTHSSRVRIISSNGSATLKISFLQQGVV